MQIIMMTKITMIMMMMMILMTMMTMFVVFYTFGHSGIGYYKETRDKPENRKQCY